MGRAVPRRKRAILPIMENIQQSADVVQKGLQLILRASVQQASTRQKHLDHCVS